MKKILLFLIFALFCIPWAANAQQALPYSYGFEDNDLSADGWTAQITSTSSGISTSAAQTGTYGFAFNYSEQNGYLISPVLTGTDAGVVVTFSYKEYSSSYGDEQFYVGYTTDETVTDPSTFTYGEIVTASLSWEEYEATFPAGTKRIAIKYVYNDAYYLYLDDFTFAAPAACPKPSNLAVNCVGNEATVTWTSDATDFNIDVNGTVISNVTSPYTLSNLEFVTTYTVKVQAVCGSETSEWTNPVSFTTGLCSPEEGCAINIALTDSYGDGWNGGQLSVVDVLTEEVLGTYTITSGSSANYTLNVCDGRDINIVYTAGSYSTENGWVVTDINDDVISEHEGCSSGCAPTPGVQATYTVNCTPATCPKPQNLTYSVSGNAVTLSWESDATAWNVEVNGVATATTSNPYTFTGDFATEYTVRVQADCGHNDVSNWTNPVAFFTDLCTSEDQCEISYSLTANESYYTGYGWYGSYIEVVDVETETSIAQLTVETGESTASGTFKVCDGRAIRFKWVSASDYDYIFIGEYTITDINGMEILAGTGALTTEVDYTVNCTELLCHQPTDLTVQCDENTATVSWSGNSDTYKVRYRVSNVIFAEDFENGLPDTWTTVDQDGDGYNWSHQVAGQSAHSGSGLVNSASYSSAALTPDNWLITPLLDLQGTMSVWMRAQDASYPAEHYAIYLSTTGNAVSDFTTVLVPEAYDLTGEYAEITADLSEYAGQQGYIAIRHFNCTDQFRLNLDDFVIYDGEMGDWNEITVDETTVDLEDLTAGTHYDVQVTGVCEGEEPLWSNMLTFATEAACSTISLNVHNSYKWEETFEGYDVEHTDGGFTNYLPKCWTLVKEYTGASPDLNNIGLGVDTLPQVFYNPSFDANNDGNQTLRMKFHSLVAMPELDESVDMSRLHLSMWVRQPQTYYHLQVGVLTDLADDSTFEPLADIDNESTNMEHFELDFSRYQGEGRYIAFKNLGGSSSNPYCTQYLDDIVLTYNAAPEACGISSLAYDEGFEGYTINPGATGVEPDCWEVIDEISALDFSTKPQLYAGFNTTEGGNYTLRMLNRCVYAMPELSSDIDVNTLTMTFSLRQPKAVYRLQVGVLDADNNFELVEEINNASADMEDVRVDFTDYTGNGHRIAFRNVLNGRHYKYSYNYLDDIHIDLTANMPAPEPTKSISDMTDGADEYLNRIAVYPNPTTGMLHIDAVDVQKVECYNQMGKLVGVYDNVNELNISELANGVYMLRITVPQGVTMRKVVKR